LSLLQTKAGMERA